MKIQVEVEMSVEIYWIRDLEHIILKGFEDLQLIIKPFCPRFY
jgi:hypothetical protein